MTLILRGRNTLLPEQLPNRPLVTDQLGIVRFRANAIVSYLLNAGPIDFNDLAMIPFSDEDHREFAQLIGYSVCGYRNLPYVRATEEALRWAEAGELARSLLPSPGCRFCDAEEAHLGSEACNRSLKRRLAEVERANPRALPPALVEDLVAVVEYNWQAERADFVDQCEENGVELGESEAAAVAVDSVRPHVFSCLARLRAWFNDSEGGARP